MDHIITPDARGQRTLVSSVALAAAAVNKPVGNGNKTIVFHRSSRNAKLLRFFGCNETNEVTQTQPKFGTCVGSKENVSLLTEVAIWMSYDIVRDISPVRVSPKTETFDLFSLYAIIKVVSVDAILSWVMIELSFEAVFRDLPILLFGLFF